MKYLNFEGLQYFYSKLSSSLASLYVSLGNLKTINGLSLLGSGNITIEGGSISQQNENIIVSLGDDSLTINGENPKTIEFFYNNRLVTGLDLNDYLPLSGGTLTGSLYMTGGTQLQLIGIGGLLYFKDSENKIMAGIETMSDHTPVGGHGAYGTIYCCYTDNSSKSTLSPGTLSLQGDKDIFIGNGDIKIDNVSIVGYSKSEADSRYLNVSGGTMTGGIVYKTPNNSSLCSIGTLGDVNHNDGTGWITCNNVGSDVHSTIQGHGLRAYARNSSDTTQPYLIEYYYDNIYIYFHQDDSTTRKYKFNLQKLIDDGYLIEE